MTERQLAPHAAPDVFRALVREAGLTDDALTPDAAWRLFTTTFAATRFSAPAVPDADSLLYQYGTYGFGAEPTFHFDFTRQFALHDSDEYLQFHCTFHYAPSAELSALGSHTEWWFRDDGTDLTAWAGLVRQRPEWAVVTAARPLRVEIDCGET